MRIAFFGDSFVQGTGDDDALGWVGRVVAKARRDGRDVTGYNLGVRRDTSANVAARWKSEASVRLSPELDGRLVFSFGANDGASSMPRAESLAHAEAILGSALRWLPTLMIGPGIIADDADATARICELSAEYANLCARLGVPYLEICRLLIDSPVWSREALAGDGAHPNRGGYAIIAEAVASFRPWRNWMER